MTCAFGFLRLFRSNGNGTEFNMKTIQMMMGKWGIYTHAVNTQWVIIK